MEYRAIIKKNGDWWIGWLIDLPGVNAQEKTKKDLLDSLKIGAEDLLSTPPSLEKEEKLVKVRL